MPLATLHLVALAPPTTIPQYVQSLRSAPVQPLVISRVIRWIIKPERLSATRLLSIDWDLLIILPADQALPSELLDPSRTAQHWNLTAGIPKALFNDFSARNSRLLHQDPATIPPLTGSLDNPLLTTSAQNLELTSDLLHWSHASPLSQQGAVSMLNLLSFQPGPDAHASYQKYGRAFAERIGKRRGGLAKLVGRVVVRAGAANQAAGGQEAPPRRENVADEDHYGWDEVALAHYPTPRHFVDMLASADYQEVNLRDRVPALRDTCILCTSEVHADLVVGEEQQQQPGSRGKGARL